MSLVLNSIYSSHTELLFHRLSLYSVKESGLEDKSEDNDIPVMATGLYHQVPKPEMNNSYVNSSIMLPRGNSYDIGNIIRQEIDSNGNVVVRMNEKPILDTREYHVKFYDG